MEIERSRMAAAVARNARRQQLQAFVADLETRAGLKVDEMDVIDSGQSFRAVVRSLETFHALMAGDAVMVRALRDFRAVHTSDRATASEAIIKAVAAVVPGLLCVEPTGAYMTASVPQISSRDGEWWTSLAHTNEDVVVAMRLDGTAGLLLDEDTFAGHSPPRWTVAYWIPE